MASPDMHSFSSNGKIRKFTMPSSRLSKTSTSPQPSPNTSSCTKMLQHHWLAQRAQALASDCTRLDTFLPEVQKSLNTFVRYQALHERLFKSALHDLLKLRAERRKEQIGFESQKRA